MAQWLDATVTRRISWNDHLFSLRFECDGFPLFKAGQFTKFGIAQDDEKVLSRPYSLVNSPTEQALEIIAVPVEEGQLSPQLHKLEVGDAAKVMAPATGFLVLDEVPASEHLWLLATGTGVGPFLSILATPQVWESYEQVVLVYAARYRDDLAYQPLINTLRERYPNRFHFVPVVSREAGPEMLLGHIPPLLAQGVIQQGIGLDISAAQSQVMLCGNPAMIQDATTVLETLGLKKHLRRAPGQITMERYW